MSESHLGDDLVQAVVEAWGEAGRKGRVRVHGRSMEPLLRPGEVVVLAHGREGLGIGQIVAYRVGGQVIVHRLVRRHGGGELVLAGDSRPAADPPVRSEAVLGRVVALEAAEGAFSLQTPVARAAGWTVAVCFPLRRWRILQLLLARLAGLGARWVRR